jgi:hypothetical protein
MRRIRSPWRRKFVGTLPSVRLGVAPTFETWSLGLLLDEGDDYVVTVPADFVCLDNVIVRQGGQSSEVLDYARHPRVLNRRHLPCPVCRVDVRPLVLDEFFEV